MGSNHFLRVHFEMHRSRRGKMGLKQRMLREVQTPRMALHLGLVVLKACTGQRGLALVQKGGRSGSSMRTEGWRQQVGLERRL